MIKFAVSLGITIFIYVVFFTINHFTDDYEDTFNIMAIFFGVFSVILTSVVVLS